VTSLVSPLRLRNALLGCLAVAAFASPMRAQRYYSASAPSKGHWEINGFGGWQLNEDIETTAQVVGRVNIYPDNTYVVGGRLAYIASHGVGAEFTYSYAKSGVDYQIAGSQRLRLDHDLTFHGYDLNVIAQSPEKRGQGAVGFFTAGLGATTLVPLGKDASGNDQSDTRFSYNLGLGGKLRLGATSPLWLRLDFRWRGIDLPTTTGTYSYCDPFYGCYYYTTNQYSTFQFMGGITYRLK